MTCMYSDGPCWTKRWTLCWTFSCPPYRSGLDGEIHGRGIGCSGSTCGLRQRPRAVYPFARRDVSSTATSRHSRGRAGLPSRANFGHSVRFRVVCPRMQGTAINSPCFAPLTLQSCVSSILRPRCPEAPVRPIAAAAPLDGTSYPAGPGRLELKSEIAGRSKSSHRLTPLRFSRLRPRANQSFGLLNFYLRWVMKSP